MKYLKKFEGKEEKIFSLFGPKVIISEAKRYLTYLLDTGLFKIDTSFYIDKKVLLNIDCNRSFKWIEFKHEIMPFIEYLNTKYNIEVSVVERSAEIDMETESDYTLEELESDNNMVLDGIMIVVSGLS